MRVVCKSNTWEKLMGAKGPSPKKDEIYTVINIIVILNTIYFKLEGFEDWFTAYSFREVDETFSEWVEATVIKEAEYEETLKELGS